MISKELLSEVLKENLTKSIKSLTIRDNNIIPCNQGSPIHKPINIHELAHKCKEWAIKNGYGISVHTSEISGFIVEINCGFDVTDFHNTSEPEAIFHACQWILDNKET